MKTTNPTNNTALTTAVARLTGRRLAWYDLSCLGLLATSIVAIAAGMLG